MDSFGDENPYCVVSDHSLALKIEKWKKDDPRLSNEKMLRAMPALLREAISRSVKIRSPQLFLTQMTSYLSRKDKAASATTSNSTIRGKPNLGRENNAKLERNAPKVVPKPSRTSSDQGKDERSFIRIDVAGRKPDIRFVQREAFGTLYSGADSGFSIFKQADSSLAEKRRREYDLFLKGRYQPPIKNYKLDEPDNYCQFCQKTVLGDRKIHERTDEHRNKVKTQGLTPTLERIVQNARLRLKAQENGIKRTQKSTHDNMTIMEKSKRCRVEYEYGENEMKSNWSTLKENKVEMTGEKSSVLSPRRRQNRILQSSSQGDYDLL
ncbi:unnamed protein product [Caenorhabditis brenneri]